MFRAKKRPAFLLTVPAVVLSLAVGGVAVAAPSLTSTVAATTDASDPLLQQLRAQTQRVKDKDPRWEVRIAASNALISDRENALAEFMSLVEGSGYMEARKRAAANDARNDLIISRAILTSTPMTSPYVHMTAKLAQHGTRDEKDRYVRVGLAEAKALDAKHAPVVHAAEQAQQDREYVAGLAENASGEWVKAAAARATQIGTNDAIADFFKYSWASAAECDLQAFRIAVAEKAMEYRSELDRLVKSAEELQAALEDVEEAAKAKAIEDAKLAWHTAADVAASTQATWAANQQLAASQAQVWQSVHDFAVQATTEQDWPTIADRATGTSTSWADELAWAQKQAQDWAGLEQRARESANQIPVYTPSPSASA